MNTFRASMTLPLLGLLVALAGCSAQSGEVGSAGSADTTTQTASAQTLQAKPAKFEHFGRMGHRPGGPEFLLVAALHAPINLSDAQKTTIEAALKDSAPKPSADGHARMSALAASVRAGKVDTTLSGGPSDAEKSAHVAAAAKAIDTLHATLTPEQRRALVDAVSKRGERGGPPAGEERSGQRRGGEHNGEARGERGREHGPMGGLLADLNLTQAQKDAIHAKMEAQKPSEADRETMKKNFETAHAAMQARLESFANDDFDATAFVTPPAEMKGEHMNPRANELAIVTSVLDASQREKLATRLEQGPPARSAVPRGAQEKTGTAL